MELDDFHDKRNSLDWDKAVAAFETGDLAGALFVFKKIARERPAALVEIGNIYEVGGQDVPQDYLEAKKWYEKSIDTIGDLKAHLALGRLYYLGFGIEQDYDRALYHFGLLEEYEEAGALFAMGCIYYYGLGVPPDEERAIGYHQQAIALGHFLSMREYAVIKIKRGQWLSGITLFVKTVVSIFFALVKDPEDKRVRI